MDYAPDKGSAGCILAKKIGLRDPGALVVDRMMNLMAVSLHT